MATGHSTIDLLSAGHREILGRRVLLLVRPAVSGPYLGECLAAYPLFAADGTHKDRQWTLRNVIERLAAIRRDKIAMGALEFDKVTTSDTDQQTILDYLKVRL